MLVHDFLEQSARRLPDKTALVFESSRLTYDALDALANKLANVLLASGVRHGDRVVVFLENSVEAVVSIFGALKAGAVFSVVNPTTKAEKLRLILASARPRAVITHASRLAIVDEAITEEPSIRKILAVGLPESHGVQLRVVLESWEAALAAQSADRPAVEVADDDLGAIVFTSGSTGTPKGVMCPHRNMVAVAQIIAAYLENVESDITLNTLQLSASYGLYQVLVAFLTGATVILERGFAYAFQAVALLQRESVTGFAAVPTMYSMLLSLKDLRKIQLPKLRYLTNAGAGLPVPRVRQLREAFPQAKLYLMYGQTECVRVCFLEPEEVVRRPDSVGKALPSTELFIVDEHDAPVGPNVTGELVVRGPHVMRGYWEAPAETARRFRPARRDGAGGIGDPDEILLFTNDLFRMDEQGYLYFVGRTDDIIKSRGEKVAPREIEHVVYDFPGIRDAAVVGVPDNILGEAIKVCVVLEERAEFNKRALLEHCRRHLEDVMIPKYVEVWPELPKVGTGKIDRKAPVHPPSSLVIG